MTTLFCFASIQLRPNADHDMLTVGRSARDLLRKKIAPQQQGAKKKSAEKGSSSGKRYREMPNLRLKVRTQLRPAQCSSGDRLPERRWYHVLYLTI